MARPAGKKKREQEASLRWSPAAYLLLAGAAILFISSTLPALQEERGVRCRHRQLRRQRMELEQASRDLHRDLHSLRQDPQTRMAQVERLRRELFPPREAAAR